MNIGFGPYDISYGPYHMGHLICWELMLVNEIILLLSEGHGHRRFLVSSSSDRDIS